MLDRASTFADPEIVELLKTRFVPVAIDQANQRRQQDTEGDFYRKIALQRADLDSSYNGNGTTQGFYVATAAGELLLYNNNRDPPKVRRLMKETLSRFGRSHTSSVDSAAIEAKKIDSRYNISAPEGGLVLRVRAKVLGGYEPTNDRWQRVFQTALSRDNLWVSASEHKALVNGQVADSLLQRIARFHLVDNTRGEPPMWRPDEIRSAEMKLDDGRLSGEVHLETGQADRGYDAQLNGVVEIKDGSVVRFDMVALGEFWGEGRYTRRAPPGKFPLAISFTLADGTDVADQLVPQAARGWLAGYLR